MRRRALVIGIDQYHDAPLTGCVNDATAIAAVLAAPPYQYDTETLINHTATRAAMRAAIADVFEDAEQAIIYFAGHGASDDFGTYLVSFDGVDDDSGVDLDYVCKAVHARGAASRVVLLIFDCCHSGAGRPRAKQSLARSADFTQMSLGGEGRILLAACRAEQLAFETSDGQHGQFTSHLLTALEGAAANDAGNITIHSLYEYLATKFVGSNVQTPVFKGDIAGLITLASGFAAPAPSGPSITPPPIESLLTEATHHLESYLRVAAPSSVEEWKTRGYRDACDRLAPILSWFDRKTRQHSGLGANKSFVALQDTALSKLQQLASLETGLHTRNGIVAEYLGGGTFGSVYKLLKDSHTTALKVYHPHDLRQGDKRARFRRGYDAMRQLDHPHIVKVGDFSECPIAFVMDYIDGPNLRKFHNSTVEPTDLFRILLIVAETLQHAHVRMVVHRDVKPENIIMQCAPTGEWVPFLTDFDLAWFSTATQFTKEGLGTVAYAAPEQLAKPNSNAAHAATTDVYAFGQLFFYVLTGSDPVPFGQADNARALAERLKERYPRAAAEAILKFYEGATAVAPDARWADFRRICDKLRKIIRYLNEAGQDRVLPLQQFSEELRYSLVGIQPNSSTSFLSISNRTRIAIAFSEKESRVGVECQFTPEGPFAFGTSNDTMRATLNARVDDAIAGNENIRRRSGKQGAYEVFVDISNIPASPGGVGFCAKIITRVVDALER